MAYQTQSGQLYEAEKAENAVGAPEKPQRDFADPRNKADQRVMRRPGVGIRRKNTASADLIEQRREARLQIADFDGISARSRCRQGVG